MKKMLCIFTIFLMISTVSLIVWAKPHTTPSGITIELPDEANVSLEYLARLELIKQVAIEFPDKISVYRLYADPQYQYFIVQEEIEEIYPYMEISSIKDGEVLLVGISFIGSAGVETYARNSASAPFERKPDPDSGFPIKRTLRNS